MKTRALCLVALLGCGESGETGAGGAIATTTSGPGATTTTGNGNGPATTGASSTSTGVAEPVPGLQAEYWSTYTELTLSRIEANLDVVWGAAAPDDAVGADRFSARWTGFVTAPKTGTYTIATENDDGLRVTIDDQVVIDDWRGHFVERHEGTIDLVAGEPVPIRVDYFELDLEAQLRLLWSTDGVAEEAIPASAFTTLGTPSGRSPKPPIQNPVFGSCADPGVMQIAEGEEPTFVMVCTGGKFPLRTARGLVFWENAGSQILPDGKPSWSANGGRNWAPEIHKVGDGWVAYFTAVNGNDVLSVGAATASDPLGPYTDIGGPLVQHADGVIDASFFEDDDGSRWLLYKPDGNAHGHPTPILIRELHPSGTAFKAGSTAKQLLVNQPSTWEGGVIEAPWLVKRDGTYFLFYSGNTYNYRYRTGVARSSTLLGDYEKHGAPILANNARWVGPGHGSIVALGGNDYYVYHAWTNAGDGTNLESEGRQVLVDRITWSDGWPVIGNGTPSTTPQPWPGE